MRRACANLGVFILIQGLGPPAGSVDGSLALDDDALQVKSYASLREFRQPAVEDQGVSRRLKS